MAFKQMLIVSTILIICLNNVQSHSWLTCPPSFNTNPTRGGHLNSLCEGGVDRASVTTVQAGDRLKVGWTSNNHGGGFVRISLIPFNKVGDEQNDALARANVLKFVCYGSSPIQTFGDCVHPCAARGGCEFQADVSDSERYDTTIGIPTNINGEYILQTAMLVGNGGTPYFSCGRLRITGGNTGLRCESNQPPIQYPCVKAAGPTIEQSGLSRDTKRGNFCFHSDRRGTVDDTIAQPPINIDCDPRLTCDNSVDKPGCRRIPGMADIIEANINPRQPRCQPRIQPQTPINVIERSQVVQVVEPQPPAPETIRVVTTQAPNNEQEANRVEEQVNVRVRTTTVAPVVRRKPNYRRPVQSGRIYNSFNGIVTITVQLLEALKEDECWQLDLQFLFPFGIGSNPFNVWDDGILVARSNRRTITIEQRPGRVLSDKLRIRASFEVNSEDRRNKWTQQNMQFLTAMLIVKPKGECFNRVLRRDDGTVAF